MKLKIEIEKVFGTSCFGLSTVRIFDPEGVIIYEITDSNELISDHAHASLDFVLKTLGLEIGK